MILVALSFLIAGSSIRSPKNPVVLISWDGAGYETIARLLSQGDLPNVRRLMKQGAYAVGGMEPPFPSKTAVSHVAMFTGMTPGHSGVTGNSAPVLPRSLHTVLEFRRGFDRGANTDAEPLWLTAAKAGKTVLALSAAGSFPPDTDVKALKKLGSNGRYVEFSGFETRVADPKMWHLNLPAGAPIGSIQVGDTTISVRRLGTSIELTQGATDFVLNSTDGRWSAPLTVVKSSLRGETAFRLFDVNEQTGSVELYQGEASVMAGTESEPMIQSYMKAYGVFHDDPWRLYNRGEFGKLSIQGGDGTAERRVLDVVKHDVEALKRSFRWGLKNLKADLTFHYQPFTDSAGHTLMGVLDPHLATRKLPDVQGERALYDSAFRLADQWLGDMMASAPPHTTFVLVSDHGMAGADKTVNVNMALEQGGLLVRNRSGQIDLHRSKVLSAPWTEYGLVVNTTEWKDGIVDPTQRESVLKAAIEVLKTVKYVGKPVFTRFWIGNERKRWGASSQASPDLEYDLERGFEPAEGVTKEVVEPAPGPLYLGRHGFAPDRPEMHSIFFAAGPGIPSGTRIRNMRAVDVTPTLLSLLGIKTSIRYDGKPRLNVNGK